MLKNLKSDEHKVRHVIYGVSYSQYNVCQVHSWEIFAEYLLIYTLWVSQFWTIGNKLKQSQNDKRLEVFFFLLKTLQNQIKIHGIKGLTRLWLVFMASLMSLSHVTLAHVL